MVTKTDQSEKGTVEVLDPTAKPEPIPLELAERPGDLRGRRVGFVDNNKTNADVFLSRIEEHLIERFGVQIVSRVRKPTATGPISSIEDLLNCDVVVNAFGD